MYSGEIKLKKEVSSITFETVLSSFSDDSGLRAQLSDASIIILPHVIEYEGKRSVFPVGTVELYSYLQENSPEDIKIDIAVKDDEYAELAQHSSLIELATIIVYGITFSSAFDCTQGLAFSNASLLV